MKSRVFSDPTHDVLDQFRIIAKHFYFAEAPLFPALLSVLANLNLFVASRLKRLALFPARVESVESVALAIPAMKHNHRLSERVLNGRCRFVDPRDVAVSDNQIMLEGLALKQCHIVQQQTAANANFGSLAQHRLCEGRTH